MENLTHSLVGLVAAKAGLERASPYATAVCVIGANLPDADVISSLGGRWFSLQHHRGITHSIAGTLALAIILPALVYAGDRLIARWRGRPPRARFRGLLLASLIACATHPLLDWTNNYGVRPFLPWSARWYYGDLVFILDPFLWLTLGGAAFLLTARTNWRIAFWAGLALLLTAAIIFLPMRANMNYPLASQFLWVAGVAGLIVAHRARLAQRWGSALAIVALGLMVCYWGGLSLAHHRAEIRADAYARNLATQNGETFQRIAAMPTLANPLGWQCVAESDRALYRFEVSLGDGETGGARNVSRFEKPQGEAAALVERASTDPRAVVFLNFARFALADAPANCVDEAVVRFADLRFGRPGATRGNFALDVPVACAPESASSLAQ